MKKKKTSDRANIAQNTLDPHLDIYAVFSHYNRKYFKNKLGAVSVSWSKRMTLCAGTCRMKYKFDQIRKIKLKEITIQLSEKLLKFRPSSDVLETLIHEMIHAYLFVIEDMDDWNDHGPKFQYWMNKINQEEGLNISIYHSFYNEVEYYRQHHWKCDKCSKLIKRSMNRAPGKNDRWWASHERNCGGKFVKIAEPKKSEKKKQKRGRKKVKSKVDQKREKKMKDFLGNFLSKKVKCPCCQKNVNFEKINEHLDECINHDKTGVKRKRKEKNLDIQEEKTNKIGEKGIIDLEKKKRKKAIKEEKKNSPRIGKKKKTTPIKKLPKKVQVITIDDDDDDDDDDDEFLKIVPRNSNFRVNDPEKLKLLPLEKWSINQDINRSKKIEISNGLIFNEKRLPPKEIEKILDGELLQTEEDKYCYLTQYSLFLDHCKEQKEKEEINKFTGNDKLVALSSSCELCGKIFSGFSPSQKVTHWKDCLSSL